MSRIGGSVSQQHGLVGTIAFDITTAVDVLLTTLLHRADEHEAAARPV